MSDTLTRNAHWVLRAALAGVFIFHGVLKLPNLSMFAQMLPILFTVTLLFALAGLGGMQFQVTLLLIMVFFVLVGNGRKGDHLAQSI